MTDGHTEAVGGREMMRVQTSASPPSAAGEVLVPSEPLFPPL